MLNKIFRLARKELFKLSNTKLSPGIWILNENLGHYSNIYIDLRNLDHAHLGDQLFFISSFLNKPQGNKIFFLINESLEDFYGCFEVNFLFNLNSIKKSEIEKSLLLTSIKSFQYPQDEINQLFSKIACYDLTDSSIEKPLYEHIYKCFFKESFEEINEKKINIINPHQSLGSAYLDLSKQNKNYYIFNDILYSRAFIRPILQKALIKKINKIKDDGLILIYVGSKNDANLESKLINFIDHDLRGKLSFYELMLLIKSKKCCGYIGFDNAIMHLSLIFHKKTYIKFRGRLLKSAYNLHTRSINCAVNKDARNNIYYL